MTLILFIEAGVVPPIAADIEQGQSAASLPQEGSRSETGQHSKAE